MQERKCNFLEAHHAFLYNGTLIALPVLLRKAMQAGGSSTMYFYTYVLRSEKDNKLYIGWSDNLRKRVTEHNKGLVTATRNRLPFRLVYYEACLSKELAIAREKQLKTGFGRAYLKKRV